MFTVVSFLVSMGLGQQNSVSETPEAINCRAANELCKGKSGPERASCLRTNNCNLAQSPQELACQESIKNFNKAQNEFKTKCGEAGLSGKCEDEVSDCYDNAGSKEFDAVSSALSQFGVQNLGQLQKKCPLMSYDKWETSHGKTEDKLNTAKKDLVQAKKDVAEAQKKYNETNTKLSKEYNDLNKDQAKAALEAKAKKREAAVAAQEAVRKGQDALFNNNMKLTDLRAQIANVYIEKAQKLAEGSAAIAKFKCTTELQEKLKKMGSGSASNFSSMMASGSSSRDSSKAVYQACIDAFLTGRQQQIAAYEAKIEAINSQITNAEENQKSLQDSLKLAQSQTTEVNADLAKADQDAQADYEAKVKDIQQQLSNNYTESVKSLQTLNERQAQLEQDVNRISNQFLSSQNGKPDDGATANYKSAAAKFEERKTAGIDAKGACGGCTDSRLSKISMLCNGKGGENKSFETKDISGEN